jgi:hypothetical protein
MTQRLNLTRSGREVPGLRMTTESAGLPEVRS